MIKTRAFLIPLIGLALTGCLGTGQPFYPRSYTLRAELQLPDGTPVTTVEQGRLHLDIGEFSGRLAGTPAASWCAPNVTGTGQTEVEAASDTARPGTFITEWDSSEVRVRPTYFRHESPYCDYFRDTPTLVFFNEQPNLSFSAQVKPSAELCQAFCSTDAPATAPCLSQCTRSDAWLVSEPVRADWLATEPAPHGLPGDPLAPALRTPHYAATLRLTRLEFGASEPAPSFSPLTDSELPALLADPEQRFSFRLLGTGTCLDIFDSRGQSYAQLTLGTSPCADPRVRPEQSWTFHNSESASLAAVLANGQTFIVSSGELVIDDWLGFSRRNGLGVTLHPVTAGVFRIETFYGCPDPNSETRIAAGRPFRPLRLGRQYCQGEGESVPDGSLWEISLAP